MAGGGGVAVASPAGGVASPILAYGARRRIEEDASSGDDAMKELYMPAGLIVLGLGAMIYQYMQGGVSIGEAVPRIGLGLLFNLVLSIAGVAMIGRLMELSFGAPGPALLKLVACCILPPAIGGIVGEIVGSDSAFVRVMTSSILMIPLTFCFIWMFFEFEWDEAMYCVLGIWLVNQWVVTLLLSLVLSGTGAAAFAQGMSAGEGDRGEDQRIEEVVGLGWPKEAKAWLEESNGRILGDLAHSASLEIVNGLYDAGAKEVLVLKEGSVASEMYVLLPRGGAARKKVFEAAATLSQTHALTGQTDEGQKYMSFRW
jgi:hypothetical protein